MLDLRFSQTVAEDSLSQGCYSVSTSKQLPTVTVPLYALSIDPSLFGFLTVKIKALLSLVMPVIIYHPI